MAVTSSITPLEATQKARAILQEWLSTYFDGAAHTINNESTTFPLCTIKFDIHQPDRPMPNPVLLVQLQEEPIDEFWNDSGVKTQRSRMTANFWVITTSGTGGQRERDVIADLLNALLVLKKHELGAAGMRRRQVRATTLSAEPAERPDYFAKLVIAAFEVDLEFEADG